MLRQACIKKCLIVLGLIFVIGCSEGSNSVVPIANPDSQPELFNNIMVAVSDYSADGDPMAGYGTLGLFGIFVDVESLAGEITPFRTTALTDVLEIVDITNFLQTAPCTDCVKLRSISLDSDENLVLSIGIRHPFDAGNSSETITGKNRADLHVFNVEGTIIAKTDYVDIFGGLNQGVGAFTLLNSDGLSSYLNIPLLPFTLNTLHPYKLHFDDYSSGNFSADNSMGFQSVSIPPPSGNLVMAMGSDYDFQDYILDISSGQDIELIYAVGCTYAVSAASKDDRFNPEFRIPQHLKKAATKVDVHIVDNHLEPGNISSTAALEIDVVDMNHGVPVGDNLDEMFADSSVASIMLCIPGILSDVVNVALINTGGAGHNDSEPLTYMVTINNAAAGGTGQYRGLVKILDSYSSGQNELALLESMDCIQRVNPVQGPLDGLYPIPEFATYQVFKIEIEGSSNQSPIAVLQPDPVELDEGYSINFNATASTDTDGAITLYEFDFEWDEVEGHFDVNDFNTTGLVMSNPYTTQGDYTAGLRVTDNLGAVDYDSVHVTVTQWGGCPNVPYAGNAFNGNFQFDLHFCHDGAVNWREFADSIIDSDILSSGYGVAIYADYDHQDGEMRIFAPDSISFTAVGTDYPGKIGVSIDVDSEDLVVFVTSSLSHVTHDAKDIALINRIAATDNYFTVIDPYTGQSSAQTIDVGSTIQAIDIDANDDVWVLDTANVMHRYIKSNGYSEDTVRQFDLDITMSGAFSGLVFDFVINFHNEGFFILTNETGQGVVWRIECDGSYDSDINGNPNPMMNVLPYDTENDVADIGIDNLDVGGNILDGAQDSQIVIVGGFLTTGWSSMVTRIDSELNQRIFLSNSLADGLTNVFINQRTNTLWGWESDTNSDSYTEEWNPPSDWE